MSRSASRWRYSVERGSWVNYDTGAPGRPQSGEWYLDYDEWRIW